jgi:SAM-dependent methyltransferase
MSTAGATPTMPITKADLDWWLDLAPTLSWHFAQTMSDMPHSYVVIGDKNQLTQEDFVRAARVIRTFGKTEKFYRHPNIYLHSRDGEDKYWVPWGPAEEAQVDLINVASASQHFGEGNDIDQTEQPVPDRFTKYDQLATEYDAMWKSPEDVTDEQAVSKLISDKFGWEAPVTLDVGCGTGLLLDMETPVSSRMYVGIDPSTAMLNQMLLKHNPAPSKVIPGAVADISDKTLIEAAEAVSGKPKFDLVIAMFAVGSYLTVDELRRLPGLVRKGGMLIAMFYADGYLPEYYTEADELPETFTATKWAAQNGLIKGVRWERIGHFDTMIWEA